jgi:integrase
MRIQGDSFRGASDNGLDQTFSRYSVRAEAIGADTVSPRPFEGVASLAFEFAILTAARSGEVFGARRDEIDIDRRLIASLSSTRVCPTEPGRPGRGNPGPAMSPTAVDA